MCQDPIVEEVRALREAYAEEFDYDLWAIHRDLKAQEAASGRKVVSFPPRRRRPVERAALKDEPSTAAAAVSTPAAAQDGDK